MIAGRAGLAGLVMAVTVALAGSAESARADPPAWWPAHVEFMTRGGGTWETPAPAPANGAQAPDAYGMQWKPVNDGAGLVGRLYGVRAGRETDEYWTFREFYHPGRGVVIIEQWGGSGVYGLGETTAPSANRGETDQTFWLPDGRAWREGHRTIEDGERYHTEVFDIDADGTWTRRDGNVWQRVAPHETPPS